MRHIVDEVTAGLLAFCLEIARLPDDAGLSPTPHSSGLPSVSAVDIFIDVFFFFRR